MPLGIKARFKVSRSMKIEVLGTERWRRLAREGRLGDAGPTFVPVEITPVPVHAIPAASPPRRTGLIEIVLGRGRHIRVDREVDAEVPRRVLQVVENLA